MKTLLALTTLSLLLFSCTTGTKEKALTKEEINDIYLSKATPFLKSFMSPDVDSLLLNINIDSIGIFSSMTLELVKASPVQVAFNKQLKLTQNLIDIDKKYASYGLGLSPETKLAQKKLEELSDSIGKVQNIIDEANKLDTLGYSVFFSLDILMKDGTSSKDIVFPVSFDKEMDIIKEWQYTIR